MTEAVPMYDADSERREELHNLAEQKYREYMRNILIGDVQEILRGIADNDEVCKRIQVNLFQDTQEVGRLVVQAASDYFWNLAQDEAEREGQ